MSNVTPFHLFLLTFLSFNILCEAEFLSKKKALILLKDNSIKWKQTQFPSHEASARLIQAKSAEQIHVSIYSRSMIAKTSQLFFGFLDSGPLNTIGFGVTGIQAAYVAYNKAYSEKIEAALENIKSANESTKNLQNEIQFLVLNKFIYAQSLEKKMEAIDVAIKKSAELVRLAQIKKRAGTGLPIDILRSEGLLEKDKIRKIETEASIFKTKKELFDLIGETEMRELPKLKYRKIELRDFPFYQNSLQSRFDIKIAHYRRQALQHLKNSVDAEKNLRVSTFADIGTVGTQAFGLFNSPTGSIGIQIEIPIFDGGLNDGKKREILNQISQIDRDYETSQLEGNTKLEIAIEQIKFAERLIFGSELQLKLTKEEMELSEKRIRFGSAGNFEMVNAQNNYSLALEAHSQALYTYEISKLGLFYTISDLDSYLNLSDEDGNG